MRKHRGRTMGRKGLELIRVRAVEQVLAGGNPDSVIRSLGFSRGCVYEWLRKFRRGGWEALKSKHISGRPHRLTAVQQAWVYEKLVGNNPLELGLGSALWTRALLAAFIQKQFQVRLSRASVGRLLHEFGLITQRPWHRAYEQNPAAMEQWLQKDCRQIRLLARHSRAEIVFLDVVPTGRRIHDAEIGADDATPPADAALRGRLLSGVSPKGQIRFMVANGQMAAESVSDFIHRLMQGTVRPLFLVVPDHPVRHERAVQEGVASFAGRLRLFVLPTTAPAHDPLPAQPPAREQPGSGPARTAQFETRRRPASIRPPLRGLVVPPVSPAPQRTLSVQSGGTAV